MALPILHDPHGRKPREAQALPGGLGLSLQRARVHEACGLARVTFAALVMGESQGPVLWIFPGWQAGRLYPPGLVDFADPARLIMARIRRPEDLLWTAEEALRSGAVPLVVAELPEPPGLTPVRRLHLAAEAGADLAADRGRAPPLGLLLTPGAGGAQGVESRWQMMPRPSAMTLIENAAAWRLTRLRARMEPPAAWDVARDAAGKVTLTPQPV